MRECDCPPFVQRCSHHPDGTLHWLLEVDTDLELARVEHAVRAVKRRGLEFAHPAGEEALAAFYEEEERLFAERSA